jgi:hypothetical protein
MFKEEREESAFEWTMLGQIDMGRPNLGFKTDVAVYRLGVPVKAAVVLSIPCLTMIVRRMTSRRATRPFRGVR